MRDRELLARENEELLLRIEQSAYTIVVEDSAGGLGGVAIGGPGHGAGNTGNLQRGKSSSQSITIGGASFFDGCLDDIDGIVSISSELIGGSAISFLILLNEVLNVFSRAISREGSEHQNVVGNGGILLYFAEDAIEAIGAEEVNVISKLAMSLGEEGRSFFRIDGDEDQLDAGSN